MARPELPVDGFNLRRAREMRARAAGVSDPARRRMLIEIAEIFEARCSSAQQPGNGGLD